MRKRALPELSALETRAMTILWQRGECTAEQVLEDLEPGDRLSNSSVRTVLRRLEAKGYVAHRLEGKAFVYRAVVERNRAAAVAARRIVDTICNGTATTLLLGMLESDLLGPEEVEALRRRIEESGGGDA